MATTNPIRDKQDIQRLTEYYLERGELRNHALTIIGIYTALRVGDILKLTWDDIYDFDLGCVRSTLNLVEEKTGKGKSIALNSAVIEALALYAEEAATPGGSILESRKTKLSIGRTQAYRIIRKAGEALGFEERISCHSLRKTLGYHAWKSNVPLAVIMEIFNHSSIANTRRYLGVTQDDTDAVYLGLDLT